MFANSTSAPSNHLETALFAWLAHETLSGRPGNRVDVTGAAGPRVLGAVWPW